METKFGQKFTIIGYSDPLSIIEINSIINIDVLYALASILFVWGFMVFHLKSYFLSTFSILSTIFSFGITSLIFQGILQIDYFSTLHILVIFIILGISADDYFVFFDAWK